MTGGLGLDSRESTKEAAISWEVWRLGLESREEVDWRGLGKAAGGGFKGGRGFVMVGRRIRREAGRRQGGFWRGEGEGGWWQIRHMWRIVTRKN